MLSVSGRRNCIGESLARVELLLFFVTLMQIYRVKLPAGSTSDLDQINDDIIRSPKPYSIIFEKR